MSHVSQVYQVAANLYVFKSPLLSVEVSERERQAERERARECQRAREHALLVEAQ